MALYIDIKFLRLVSYHLRNFKQKKESLFNFSCPFCGDSHSDLSKARGYAIKQNDHLVYKCFNCGKFCSFVSLLKHVNPMMYEEYIMEKYRSNTLHEPVKSIETKLKSIRMINQKRKYYDHSEWCNVLPKDHKCIQYLKSRKIPEKYYSILLYTDKFKDFVDVVYPNNDKILDNDERLVFPMYDEYNELIGVAGRSFTEESPRKRYITIKISEDIPRLVFGLERIDKTKTIYVVEGQVDSLFIDNCIAMCGADLNAATEYFDKEKLILIPDNEPRAKEQVKIIQKFVDNDFSVVLFPESIIEKDINLMVQNGIDVVSIINKNTFKGIRAQLEFKKWKKIQ